MQITFLAVLAVSLATWRMTHILLRENGPWGLFRRFRIALGVTYDPVNPLRVVSFRYEITVCVWCLSVWVGAVYTALILLTPPILVLWLALPFAFSAVAVILDQAFGLH